jgi:hypothetical protein
MQKGRITKTFRGISQQKIRGNYQFVIVLLYNSIGLLLYCAKNALFRYKLKVAQYFNI